MLTIARVKPLDAQLSDSLATERFQTLVLMTFGTAALLLAMLGIYGVLSYSTVTRKQEIGVRMALGATRREIYALTVGEAGTPVFTGLAAGVLASILVGRVVQKLLYGIRTVDARRDSHRRRTLPGRRRRGRIPAGTPRRLRGSDGRSALRTRSGVAFDEAASAFFDPLSATGNDPDHSLDERRFVIFGMSSAGRLLVVHTRKMGT